jgi:serine/threonine protein kinase
MQVMVYLRHPNIVTVMGAVVQKSVEPLMVMENMKHGSLFDLLHNTTMHFDGEMLMAMLEDIVSGMNYLHSTNPPVLHNDLKTGNVLVGANFQAKLADFGLTMKEKSSGDLGTPFWMAPELFQVGAAPTTKTDVYSFAITMMEMFTRAEPYTEHDDPEWVLEQLALGEDADELLRPKLPDGLPVAVKTLIEECWHPDPAQRPQFTEIRTKVAAFDVDEISRWFEKLDAGSERAISDSEKHKRLLHEVFPPHIAKQLKEGKKVEPQQHDCVTIFFSDIVGFTDISRQLKPFQVMNMLDRLYDQLDEVARKHSVFKVETIGDAYMAVANLVREQPDHTKLIAQFAQEAITVANGTLIQEDKPELGFVNIRVGFHSGE